MLMVNFIKLKKRVLKLNINNKNTQKNGEVLEKTIL